MKKPDRFKESLASNFKDNASEADVFILAASSDSGVRLNLGRAGARFAPKAITNVFKKMASHSEKSFLYKTVSVETTSLEKDQEQQIKNIKDFLKYDRPIIHLGGGHDHIYPLVMALEDKSEEVVIINLDAHMDTRVDDIHHSGTPFRNLDEKAKNKITLIQYGIHDFANTKTTKSDLKNITQHIISFEKLKTFTEHFSRFPSEILSPFLQGNKRVIISLDADAIESSIMSGVSAVNHEGIPLSHIKELIELVTSNSEKNIFGIYEYNPIYDDLSQKGARALASLIYTYLN